MAGGESAGKAADGQGDAIFDRSLSRELGRAAQPLARAVRCAAAFRQWNGAIVEAIIARIGIAQRTRQLEISDGVEG